MKNEFELLTELLFQYPYHPVQEPQFSETVNRETARLFQHFQNREDFGKDAEEQYGYLSWQSIYMMEMHKNLDKLPRPLQIKLVKAVHTTVGLIREHLRYLVPLQPSSGDEEAEMAEVEKMDSLIRQKEAAIDQRQGDKLDKLKATAEAWDELYGRRTELTIDNNKKIERVRLAYKRRRRFKILRIVVALVVINGLINLSHSYFARGTINCKARSTTFLFFAPTISQSWDWSVCDVKQDTLTLADKD